MPEITATEASRSFRAMLDAVTEERATYTITRHGESVAVVGPPEPRGMPAEEFLGRLRQAPRPDDRFADDLDRIRREQPAADITSWD